MEVRIAEKSFSVNNSCFVIIGVDNDEKLIERMIETVYERAKLDIQEQLRNAIGIKP